MEKVVETSNCDSTGSTEIARAGRLTVAKEIAGKTRQKKRKVAACVSSPTGAEGGLRLKLGARRLYRITKV